MIDYKISYKTEEIGDDKFYVVVRAEGFNDAVFRFGYDWGVSVGEPYIYPGCKIVSVSIYEGSSGE